MVAVWLVDIKDMGLKQCFEGSKVPGNDCRMERCETFPITCHLVLMVMVVVAATTFDPLEVLCDVP